MERSYGEIMGRGRSIEIIWRRLKNLFGSES